jgi:hypothetical protein
VTRPLAEWDDQTLDLALEEVTVGLQRASLEDLLTRIHAEDLELLERSAAAVQLASLGQLERPPASLIDRLESDGLARLGLAGPRPTTDSSTPGWSRARTAWVSAAGWIAATLLAIAAWTRSFDDPTADPARRRDSLMADASDLVRAQWQSSADPLAGGLSGDVVWSRARQEGYMTFRGLAPNDPKQAQYQLWIFDSTRDEWEAKPVDGGVFDVELGAEVVVPMVAKLEVREAALFALTLEAPGGVVVSKREHLLATAAL